MNKNLFSNSSPIYRGHLMCFIAFLICLFFGMNTHFVYGAESVKVRSLSFYSLDINTVTISKGATYKIKTSIKPSTASNKKLSFTSTNPAIAKVSSTGRVKGIGKGTATIIIRTTDGSKKRLYLRVTVGTKVSSLKLSSSNKKINLYSGNIVKMSPSVSPKKASNKKLIYSSSNSSVATVSSYGNIRAKRNGTATITATSTDGTKKKISCTVTVTTLVSSISFTDETLLINLGSTASLPLTVSPSTASNPACTYASSNTAVATVDSSGKITGVSKGSATITAKSKDGTNKTASCKVYVTSFIAHRGYSGVAPENSMAAFNLSGKYGFWGSECDIRVSSDGEFMISHNASLKEMCGVDVPLSTLTSSQIKSYPVTGGNNASVYPNQTILTLEEYTAILASYPNMNPVIELKDSTFTEAQLIKILDLLDQYNLRNKTTFISFQTSTLDLLRKLDTTIRLQRLFSYSTTYTKITSEQYTWCYQRNIDIGASYKLITQSDVIKAHSLGLELGVWTIGTLERSKTYASYGVDYITSDYKFFQ